MRCDPVLQLRRRVLALALLVMAAGVSTAADTVSTPGVSQFSYGSYEWNALPSVVQIGYEAGPRFYVGEYYSWRGLLQFSVPDGTYSAATLTFSASPSFQAWGRTFNTGSAATPIAVGLFELARTSPVSPYTLPTCCALYGSLDMTWPGSYSVALTSAAVADINSAAGSLFNVTMGPTGSPLMSFPTDIIPPPQGATILNAFLQLTPAVPEPAEWTMLIVGLFTVGFVVRARRT